MARIKILITRGVTESWWYYLNPVQYQSDSPIEIQPIIYNLARLFVERHSNGAAEIIDLPPVENHKSLVKPLANDGVRCLSVFEIMRREEYNMYIRPRLPCLLNIWGWLGAKAIIVSRKYYPVIYEYYIRSCICGRDDAAGAVGGMISSKYWVLCVLILIMYYDILRYVILLATMKMWLLIKFIERIWNDRVIDLIVK